MIPGNAPNNNPATPPAFSVLGVIPARLASTRLPRKVLRSVAGRPLLAWVVEAAQACPLLDAILIAVDSEEVATLCRQQGWLHEMTSPSLPSGTDRLQAIAALYPAAIYVNIQADEPLLTPEHLTALLHPFTDPAVDVTTLRVPCPPADIANPNIVKVVIANTGRALYFSRAPIPYNRDQPAPLSTPVSSHLTATPYWKHLGLYAYRAAALARFAALPPSSLEQIERLEQLRLLENGLALHVANAPADTIGVDTEEDLRHVEQILLARPLPKQR